MQFNRRIFLSIFAFLLAFNLVWDLYLYTLPSKTTAWNYLYNGTYGFLYLLAALVPFSFIRLFGIKSGIGKMLLFLGLGMLSFEVGLLIWVYYNFLLKVSIPFPSLADAAFLVFYPLMAIGSYFLLMIYSTLVTKKLLRDSIIIIIVSFLIIFGLFSRPDLSTNLSFLEKFINVFYPTGDVITLSIALIALRIGGGKIHSSLYIFCFGILLETAADLLFTYRTAKGIYWNGDIADLMYTFSAIFIGIGLVEIINGLTKRQSTPVQLASTPILPGTTVLPTTQPAEQINSSPINI